jgi:hypothetical protein
MTCQHAFRKSAFVWFVFMLSLALAFSLSFCAQKNTTSSQARVDRLALEVERAQSVRAVKALQHSYAQFAQFGLWLDMASLFAEGAELVNGDKSIQGRAAIGDYFLKTLGHGKQGLQAGEFRAQLAFRPLVNISADGQKAKGRWWEFSMFGRTGISAEWAAGIYENEYMKEQGVWKISCLRYFPMFAGPYETGWRNVDADLKIVPYHFTAEEAGMPVLEIPPGTVIPTSKEKAAARLTVLDQQISAMNDEDSIRNLQNAYGYYVDRKMWDDVTDLFAADGALEIANIGIYDGVKSIRRAFERNGPAGLSHGQLHDHLQLDMTVSIEPGGTEARARGLEFGMLGEAGKGEAFMSLSVFENRYLKQNGIWRILEMRIFPVRKTEYRLGWAKSVVGEPMPAREFAPDRAIPASDVMAEGAIPVFITPNMATGAAVRYPANARIVAKNRLLSTQAAVRAPKPSISPDEMGARIEEAERKLAVSKAYDGTENVSSAYGDYLDDLDFGELAKIFALKGVKEIPFTGFYVGRESIARRETSSVQSSPKARTSLTLHLRTQPVILVANDGRSSSIRTRLFQPASSRNQALGFSGGMYHDQAILENGSWKLWSVAIDEHYFSSPNYQGGWSAAKDPSPGALRLGAAAAPGGYPPDIPLTALGERQRGFLGGTGNPIVWPAILPMWFHYRNPVSGRVPENFWLDCVTCAYAPNTSMKNHGYQLPPW